MSTLGTGPKMRAGRGTISRTRRTPDIHGGEGDHYTQTHKNWADNNKLLSYRADGDEIMKYRRRAARQVLLRDDVTGGEHRTAPKLHTRENARRTVNDNNNNYVYGDGLLISII